MFYFAFTSVMNTTTTKKNNTFYWTIFCSWQLLAVCFPYEAPTKIAMGSHSKCYVYQTGIILSNADMYFLNNNCINMYMNVKMVHAWEKKGCLPMRSDDLLHYNPPLLLYINSFCVKASAKCWKCFSTVYHLVHNKVIWPKHLIV